MNKFVEVLKNLLPEDQVKDAAAILDEMFKEATAEISKQKEAEFNKQLEVAYNELSAELKSAEKTAEQGYEEAYAIIADLRNRIEVQKEEFDNQMEENFEEAYQMLLSERAKNSTMEVEIYEEYEKKYLELKEQFVDMLHRFLEQKGGEIAEQVRRDILSDPRTAEHKVALDKIIEIAAGYLGGEEVALATSSRLEDAHKQLEEMRAQIKVMEARNIRLARENEKLSEGVDMLRKSNQKVVAESTKAEKKERIEGAKNASGRGRVVTEQETKVIAEHSQETASAKDTKPSNLVESLNLGVDVKTLQTLAGRKASK